MNILAKRSLALLVLFIFLVTAIVVPLNWLPNSQAAIVGVQPPADGDWVIDENTTVTDETVVLNGNLVVTNSSKLSLVDSTIKLNCTADGDYGIMVGDGSSLEASNTIFTRNGDHAYTFYLAEGSTGILEGSTVEYAAGSGDDGPLMYTSDLVINNTVFRESEYGLAITGSATITNSTFYNNTLGLLFYGGVAANDVVADNLFEKDGFNNSAAKVRYAVTPTITVVDHNEAPVEDATVYLNDTFATNVVDDVTDGDGKSYPDILVTAWEIQNDDTNVSYEPYDLTALKLGKENTTQVNPSQGSDLDVELPLRADLTVDGAELMWGPGGSIPLVPAGRDNDTLFTYNLYFNTDDIPDGWYETDYNDSDWLTGAAPFGDRQTQGVDENTDWDENSESWLPTRHWFYLPDDITIDDIVLNIAFNNYALPYINGHLIFDERGGDQHGAQYWNNDGMATLNNDWLNFGGYNLLAVRGHDGGGGGYNSQWLDMELMANYVDVGRLGLVVDQEVIVVFPVENQGVAEAQGAAVELYNGSTLIGSTSFDIAAGGTRDVSFEWTPDTRGYENLTVKLDPDDSIEEELEDNNEALVEVFVGDFGVNITTDSNTSAKRFNETVYFDLNLTNVGDIDDNITLMVNGLPRDWEVILTPELAPLGPGNSTIVNLTIHPEVGADTGFYDFSVVATSKYGGTQSFGVVPSGLDNETQWKWLEDLAEEDDIPENWTKFDFDDSSWDWDPAPFGDSDLGGGRDRNTEWSGNEEHALFRHYFTIPSVDGVIQGATMGFSSNNYGSYYLNEELLFSDWNDGQGHGAEYWNEEDAVDLSLLRMDEVNLVACLVEERTNTQWFDAALYLDVLLGSVQPASVEIEPTHFFDLNQYAAARNHPTNTTQYYPIRMTNFGHFEDVIQAELTILDSTGDWTAQLVNTSRTMAAGAADQFDIEVFGEPTLESTDYMNLSVDLWMEDLPWIKYTYHLNLTAEPPFHEFDLDAYYADEMQLNGTTITYYIDINNLGNVQDTFVPTLNITGISGIWDVSFSSANLSIHAYSEAQLGIIVESDEDLRFWDYLNLTVNLTIVRAPELYHIFTLNITPYFNDNDPPDTNVVELERWARESNITIEWEVTRDRDDTAYFYVYYRTMDPDGATSDYELWDIYPANVSSDTFEVEHGWVYYFYSLGQDGSNNLELDRGTYDTYVIVDLEPPTSGFWLTELGEGVAKGISNSTELGLNWEPVNATEDNPDYDYTIQVRNRTLAGAFGPWATIEGLNNVSIQQGEYNPLDGRIYQFRSIATDEAGWVEDKIHWDVQVTIDASPPRSGLERPPAITKTDTHTLDLVYDDKDDVERLQVHFAQFPDGEPPIEYTWLNGGSFQGANVPDELTFSQLKDGQRYIYRLMATDDNHNQEVREGIVEYYTGNGSHGQSLKLAKLPVPAPTVPYSRVTVVVEGVEDTTLLEYFQWDDIPAYKNTAFHLDYDTGTINFGDASTGYVPFDGAKLRITYDAYDAWTVVDTSAPNAPSAIHRFAFDGEAGTATLSWHPSSSDDVVAYRLEMATDISGPWTEVETIPAPAENRDINDIVVDGLSADTKYHFHVIAIDRADWESGPNNPITVNEKPVTSNGDDDDGGSGSGVLLMLLLVVLAFAGAMAFILNKRRTDMLESDVEGTPVAATGQLVPVTGEVAAGAGLAVVEEETGFEEVPDSEGEFACLACGMFFRPDDAGPTLTCPACAQVEDRPGNEEVSVADEGSKAEVADPADEPVEVAADEAETEEDPAQ